MANILFGLHRLQRIAYGPFSKKVISREAFVYHSDVISGARQSHLGDFWAKKRSSQVSEVDLSKRPPGTSATQCNPVEPRPELNQTGPKNYQTD